ncbi:MAG: hypothetical protein BWX64_02328 [Acidobacteria bacterium ADurb.Bin051]|nr:MAG: hypothetical protein BWX64_02328 [Acidobacteria bacterium ADurb.Bin051]
MKRESGRRHVQGGGECAGGEPLGTPPHQLAEELEAGLLREGSETSDGL